MKVLLGGPIKKTASRSRAYSCLPSVVCRKEETMGGIIFVKGYRLRPGEQRKKS
nr:MAG TPA: phospho-N-acetylmuramoyl-pentapeptide-transferase [Caudoviricetes sp.]